MPRNLPRQLHKLPKLSPSPFAHGFKLKALLNQVLFKIQA